MYIWTLYAIPPMYNPIFKNFASKISILLLNVAIVSSAQDKIQGIPKVYKSPSGEIYWNKNLPVYIRISTSPEDTAPSYLIEKSTTPEYANPFYLDTEGDNFIRTRWAINKKTKKPVEPKTEVTWRIMNDSKAPVTNISFDKSNFLVKGKYKYFNNGFKVTLNSTDLLSGVDVVYASINGDPYQVYKGAISFENSGTYTLRYYAIDKVGNTEDTHKSEFVIDADAPETQIVQKGTWYESTCAADASIRLSATDGSVGLKKIIYKLDDNKIVPYQAPILCKDLSEGAHTLVYYALDELGNKEEDQSLEFYVDKSGPLLTSEVMGDKFVSNGKEFSSGRTRIKLTAIDNKSGVKEIWYSINNEKPVLYDQPFYIKGKSGNTSIRYYALDQVMNKSKDDNNANRNIKTPYLDLSGPKVNSEFKGKVFVIRDTVYISPKTKLILQASDTESGLQKITYSVNGGTENDYNTPLMFDKEGLYNVNMVAYDKVNNTNNKEIIFVVDESGPDIFTTFSVHPISKDTINSDLIEIYPAHTEVFVSASDNKVGAHTITYSINGQKEEPYSLSIRGFPAGALTVLKVNVYDLLGNVSSKEVRFKTLSAK